MAIMRHWQIQMVKEMHSPRQREKWKIPLRMERPTGINLHSRIEMEKGWLMRIGWPTRIDLVIVTHSLTD